MKTTTKKSVFIIPSVFKSPGKDGDFGWMINQDEYFDSFFIFNDNEEQFLAHKNNPEDSKGIGCQPGGGNAVIRPWQCKIPPRAGGIPTGTVIGYKNLSQKTSVNSKAVKDLIDEAIDHIKKTVIENNFKKVYFSSENKDVITLGTGIFKVGEDVKKYIVFKITTLLD